MWSMCPGAGERQEREGDASRISLTWLLTHVHI